MGLFIVNETVVKLGGRLTLESREGDTVFSGFIPRRRLQLSGSAAEEDARQAAPQEVSRGEEGANDAKNDDKCEEKQKKDDNFINQNGVCR